MSNFNFNKNSIVFRINGADKFTSFIIIVSAIAAAVLCMIFTVFLGSSGFFERYMILSAVIIFIVFAGLIILLLLLVKAGVFSRYTVTVARTEIKVYDKRKARELFCGETDKNRFYIADTRQQVGYISTKLKALCYGPVKQIFVEDLQPSEEFILLCTGPAEKINELKNRIFSEIG